MEQSGGEIEDQHFGGFAVRQGDAGLAGEQGGVAAVQRPAIDIDRAARDVNIALAPAGEG